MEGKIEFLAEKFSDSDRWHARRVLNSAIEAGVGIRRIGKIIKLLEKEYGEQKLSLLSLLINQLSIHTGEIDADKFLSRLTVEMSKGNELSEELIQRVFKGCPKKQRIIRRWIKIEKDTKEEITEKTEDKGISKQERIIERFVVLGALEKPGRISTGRTITPEKQLEDKELIVLARNKSLSPRMRDEAIETLGERKVVDAADVLIEALGDKSVGVQCHALSALRKIGDGDGRDVVIRELMLALQNKNRSVRYHSAELLGDLGAKEAVEVLKKCLEDKDDVVRRDVKEALEKLSRIKN